MRRSTAIGRCVRAVLAAAAAAVVCACGASPITSTRLETSMQTTFANLVELQVSRMGLPRMPAPDFAVTAICRKQAAGESGSGEWSCTMVWQGPDRRTLRDTYDLFVGTDGCYTATVGGESLGGPTLRSTDGRPVKNLLYAFESCFDTT